MRSLSFVGVVLLSGMMACASSVIAATGDKQMCVPMGSITLAPPQSVTAKRVPVEFPHSAHFTLACNTCHHTWKGTEPITGCRATGCHDLDTLPRKPDSKGIDKANAFRYYKNAYHGKCITCHKRMKRNIQQMATTLAGVEGKLPTTGPTGCIGCHPKK
jgi:Class III cytochrome C family